MTQSLALAHLLLASSSKSTSSSSAFLTLLPLLAIGVLGYFFFIKPQQRKAQAVAVGHSQGDLCRAAALLVQSSGNIGGALQHGRAAAAGA